MDQIWGESDEMYAAWYSRKPNNQPTAVKNTPPLVPSAPTFPRRGHCPMGLTLDVSEALYIAWHLLTLTTIY